MCARHRTLPAILLLLVTLTATAAAADAYVTFGSTPTDVRSVLGEPSRVAAYPGLGEEVWSYGLSRITFRSGVLSEWSDHERRLRVWIGDRVADAAPFTRGSTPQDVINAQGTPTSVQRFAALREMVWSYGLSRVTFRRGQVAEWSDYSRVLHATLGARITSAAPIQRGSTVDQVVAAMGTPTSIQCFEALGEEVWSYGLSRVTLLHGRVSEWTDYGRNLKVTMGSRVAGAPPVTMGSSQDAVVAALGTPTGVQRYEALREEVWSYGLSRITLREGRVTEWSDYGRNLNISMGARSEAAPAISLGVTRHAVIAALGTPSGLQRFDALGEEILSYGFSSITLRGGRVAGWNDVGEIARGSTALPRYTQEEEDLPDAEVEPAARRFNAIESSLPAPSTAPSTTRWWTARDSTSGATFPFVAENGSYYGEISTRTYLPKTTYVRSYFRKDGTYVRSHFRSRR